MELIDANGGLDQSSGRSLNAGVCNLEELRMQFRSGHATGNELERLPWSHGLELTCSFQPNEVFRECVEVWNTAYKHGNSGYYPLFREIVCTLHNDSVIGRRATARPPGGRAVMTVWRDVNVGLPTAKGQLPK